MFDDISMRNTYNSTVIALSFLRFLRDDAWENRPILAYNEF
jgi:hypothetical protein